MRFAQKQKAYKLDKCGKHRTQKGLNVGGRIGRKVREGGVSGVDSHSKIPKLRRNMERL